MILSLIAMFMDATLRRLVDRQTAIIQCMCLLPSGTKYKDVDRALRHANIRPETLYTALCVGRAGVTTSQFYAAMHSMEKREEVT